MADSVIGFASGLVIDVAPAAGAAKKTCFKSLEHAGNAIIKTARESMVFTKGPSPAGTPPHAHRGRLRRDMRVGEEGGHVYAGVSYEAMTTSMYPPWMARIHEEGGTFTGRKKRTVTFPARPFMLPALERNIARFESNFGTGTGE